MAKKSIGAAPYDRKAVLQVLNRILENELAAVVRYTQYSFMIFGFNRIPIVSWLREQAKESLVHAERAGEMITHLGAYPSLAMGEMLESHNHDLVQLLEESYYFERDGLELYRSLLNLVDGKDLFLEEYARQLMAEEERHLGEIDKMLRHPGEVKTYSPKKRK